MMWLALALVSALFLGIYDVNKKLGVHRNNVFTILFLNTFIYFLILVPFVSISKLFPTVFQNSIIHYRPVPFHEHLFFAIKALIILSSRICTYLAIKNLPITITSQLNVTRPVMTLIGGIFIFGDRLNIYEWIGVLITILAIVYLGFSGRKEGINFSHNKWVIFMVFGCVLGALSNLYDKFMMIHYPVITAQFWFIAYQSLFTLIMIILIWAFTRNEYLFRVRWTWSIVLVSFFLLISDFIFFYALKMPHAMISLVTIVRRSGVIVSFVGGIIFFHEKNLKSKAVVLCLLIIAMFFLYLGSK